MLYVWNLPQSYCWTRAPSFDLHNRPIHLRPSVFEAPEMAKAITDDIAILLFWTFYIRQGVRVYHQFYFVMHIITPVIKYAVMFRMTNFFRYLPLCFVCSNLCVLSSCFDKHRTYILHDPLFMTSTTAQQLYFSSAQKNGTPAVCSGLVQSSSLLEILPEIHTSSY